MIRVKTLIFTFLMVSTAFLSADFEDDIVSQEKIEDPEHQGPFRAEFAFDIVSRANFDESGFEDQDLSFSCFAGRLASVICYSKERREAFMLAVGAVRANIDWDENPFFSQTIFRNGTLSLRFYSNRLNDWVWQAQVTAIIDTDHWDFNHYLDFDILLWGRYEYCDNVHLHAGFIAQTGMLLDRIYPVIGFDWTINDYWTLNLVFPVNISLEYNLNDDWKAALAIRFFDVRERAGEDEPLPQALVCYRNTGLEFALKYEWSSYVEWNIHAGYTFAGDLRISNKHNDHPKHFDLDPAGYFGSELVLKY